jgi:hypothetical protein
LQVSQWPERKFRDDFSAKRLPGRERTGGNQVLERGLMGEGWLTERVMDVKWVV